MLDRHITSDHTFGGGGGRKEIEQLHNGGGIEIQKKIH